MLTGFTWCIPLKTKTADEVTKAYLDHIYSLFGGSVKIMTDNGTEFKNKLFKEVIVKLSTEFSIHSPPYRPQSNGKIEGFHRFLKTCIGKHINHGLEWDELTPMATAFVAERVVICSREGSHLQERGYLFAGERVVICSREGTHLQQRGYQFAVGRVSIRCSNHRRKSV